jgi:hypothetical protein
MDEDIMAETNDDGGVANEMDSDDQDSSADSEQGSDTETVEWGVMAVELIEFETV